MKKIIAVLLIMILLINGILFALRKIDNLTFFVIIAIAYIYVRFVQKKIR